MANNEAFEKALDLLIEEALDKISEQEYDSSIPVSDIEFSKEHEMKMKRFFRKLHRGDLKHSFIKHGRRAACVCLVAIIITAVTVNNVDAWKTKYLKLFYDEDAPNSDYIFSNSAGTSYTDENVALAYLPQGFELTKETITSKEVILRFLKDDLFLKISISDLNMQFNTDTENATVEHITIQGYDAIGIYKHDLNQVIWSDDENAYHVAGNLPREEIEKIAENCKKN